MKMFDFFERNDNTGHSFHYRYQFPFILLLIILFSCKQSTDNEQKDVFNMSYHVKGRVLIPAQKLIDPWRLLNIDSVLIVGNEKGEPVLEVYDLHGTKMNAFLTRGNDKNSVLMIGTLQPDYVKKRFYVYDLFRRKLLSLSLKDILTNNKIEPELISNFAAFDSSLDLIEKIYVLGNSFIGTSRSTKGRLLLFNQNGSKFFEKIPYPSKIDKDLSDEENASLYSSGIAIAPDESKVAISTYNAGMLDFYKLENNDLKLLWSDTSFLPSGLKRIALKNTTRIAFTTESISGYQDVCVTKDFVYAIYAGKKIEKKDYNYSNEIRVVSWDGKKKYKLILDRMIKRLSVSQDNSQIYAISANEKNEPEIVLFEIKNR